MPFSEKEMREDLRKVRIRQYTLFFGGLGILGLTIALFVVFLVNRELAALLLAGVGLFWAAVLGQQALRTRRLAGLISARVGGAVSREEEGAPDRPGRPGGEPETRAPAPETRAPEQDTPGPEPEAGGPAPGRTGPGGTAPGKGSGAP